MKLNHKFVILLVIAHIALALCIAACATALAAPNPVPNNTNNVQPAAQSAPVQQPPANPQPAAPKPGSLMDAPLNRTKFPNGALTTSDKQSFVGRQLKIQGEGYPAGTKLDLVWGTMDANFKLGDQLEFYDFQFSEKNVPIASVVADQTGKFVNDFTVPEDFGGVHNIYALSNGEKVMQTGLEVWSEYTVSPTSGPSGTPISIKITGIGYAKWEEVRAIGYDNQYVGFVNGIMTKGTATTTIRATGGVGKHVIRIGTWTVPYLNIDQAPNYKPGLVQEIGFNVTSAQPAQNATNPQTEWMPHSYPDLQANPGTVGSKGERLTVTPNVGTVGMPLRVSASGFAPNTTIELQWEAMRGNRLQGWNPKTFPLDKITTDANGKFDSEVKMPDDLGGSHALIAIVSGNRVADARVVIEPSFLEMTPRSGPAGTEVKIVLKGVGWTEVDNTYAVTFDNGLMGYACGFNSAGDVTIHTQITGATGWHYIDFWPEIYVGHNQSNWLPILPWLSLGSHPGLPKPAFHLAFQVTE